MDVNKVDLQSAQTYKVCVPLSKEYERRYARVREVAAGLREEFSLALVDASLYAALAYRLTQACGFPVFVAGAWRKPESGTESRADVVAYPVPWVEGS